MFSSKEVSLSIKECIEIFSVLEKIRSTDEVLNYVVLMNMKALKPVIDSYNDENNGLIISHAYERDGVIAKEKEGGYQFSKESRKDLDKAQLKLSNKKVTVKLIRVSANQNQAIASLGATIKMYLMDNILIVSSPENPEKKKDESGDSK